MVLVSPRNTHAKTAVPWHPPTKPNKLSRSAKLSRTQHPASRRKAPAPRDNRHISVGRHDRSWSLHTAADPRHLPPRWPLCAPPQPPHTKREDARFVEPLLAAPPPPPPPPPPPLVDADSTTALGRRVLPGALEEALAVSQLARLAGTPPPETATKPKVSRSLRDTVAAIHATLHCNCPHHALIAAHGARPALHKRPGDGHAHIDFILPDGTLDCPLARPSCPERSFRTFPVCDDAVRLATAAAAAAAAASTPALTRHRLTAQHHHQHHHYPLHPYWPQPVAQQFAAANYAPMGAWHYAATAAAAATMSHPVPERPPPSTY